MPAPVYNDGQTETRILDNHTIELKNKAQRAANAYTALETYNFNGSGVMPTHTWTAPTGRDFTFTPGLGELEYDGAVYSSINSQKKKEFFQYLPRFIAECMKNYDLTYGL